MPVEFIGLIRTKPASELNSTPGSLGDDIIDPAYVREFAKAHEEGGFDKVLIGYSSSSPDGLTVASFAASATERLGFLIAHRPGFVAPTLAARKAATLDHFTNGRIAIHIITGGSDADQQKDGDWLDHDSRYRRTNEYLEIVRRVWTSDTPFDYEGEFYRIKDAFSAIKPLQQPHIPLYFGGASGPAVQVGAKHSNVYALWGEPIAAVKERIAEVRAALPPGRSIRFSVSLRPILGATEQEAWEKAHNILGRIQELRGGAKVAAPARPQAVGSQRLLDFAAKNEVYDKRLWTPIAAATGAAGNTTALVGTPEQVAEALVDYYDAGVTTLLIRGFDPLEDAIAYGRDVIPLVHAEVARRERQTVGAGSR
ncbi:MAG: LLM class flavin-dependent oxidoreductase [Nostoc sp.]|uniref:LLM class flavin-dependent oxidoreductase n=1 Tax=Nostoc sp. TaxID=1180 RepID=UPI002FFBC7B3